VGITGGGRHQNEDELVHKSVEVNEYLVQANPQVRDLERDLYR